MGERRNIQLVYENRKKIFLYTHWDAEELENILRKALIRGESRWDDESYLARIIFSEMIKDDVEGTTGYGISTEEIDPEFETIVVKLKKQTVNDETFEDFINNNNKQNE